eukprot:scaffold162_cov267-Chaetoceros_neogracile.AAC.52
MYTTFKQLVSGLPDHKQQMMGNIDLLTDDGQVMAKYLQTGKEMTSSTRAIEVDEHITHNVTAEDPPCPRNLDWLKGCQSRAHEITETDSDHMLVKRNSH